MKCIRLTFLLLVFGGICTNTLSAQSLSLEWVGGSSFNFPTPLTVHQEGYPDIRTNAIYDTKPFGPFAAYFAWRAVLWDKNDGWELGQIHQRIFLTNPPSEIQVFAVHFGYNFFLLGHAWKRGGLIYHLAIGPIIGSPESTVRNQVEDETGKGFLDVGYYLSGIGAEAALEKDIYFIPHAFIALEAAFTAGFAWWVPISNGYADVPNMALHAHLGFGYDF